MATTAVYSSELVLTDEERVTLRNMLEIALRETRVEIHHTHNRDFRALVQHQESVIRGLLAKLSPPQA